VTSEIAMHISAKPLSAYPWYIRFLFRAQKRKFGAVLMPALVWGRAPRPFAFMTLMYASLHRKGSPFSPALRALAAVRVSQVVGCHFCVDMNAKAVLDAGVAPEKLSALADWRASPRFDERERAVLDYAEAMSRTGAASGAAPEAAAVERLIGFFGEDAVVELTAIVAFQNMSSRFNVALGIPAQGLCPVPAGGAEAAAESKTAGAA